MSSLQHAPLHALSWSLYDWCLAHSDWHMALDIGANDGSYSEKMVQFGFRVIAFEPVPSEFKKLVSRVGDNPDVQCRNIGLSDKRGLLEGVTICNAWTIGTPETTGMGVNADFVDKDRFDVVLSTVDHECQGLRIGIIKLDVDGYEPKVWRGAKETIARDTPPILCELSGYYANCGEDAEQFVNDVVAAGYWFVSMDGKIAMRNWREIKPCWPWGSSYDCMLIPERLINEIPS